MKKVLGVMAAALIAATSGCASVGGTIFTSAKSPYVGVAVDAEVIAHSEPQWKLVALADLPFSTAVDTVLLPVTLPTFLGHMAEESSRRHD